jgi:TRAP-type C4-dicarboxylate transport system permease small subunit
MRGAFLRIYSLYSKLLFAVAVLAGIFTFAIMWVIDLNAFTRKIFNAPVPAALEITQSLMVVAIMAPFAYTLLKRDHVNTTVLTAHFPPAAQRWLHFVWMVVGFLLFAGVTYGAFDYGMRSYRMNEQIWGATIQFPLWPAKVSVCIATALLSIQFLLDAIGTALIPDFYLTQEDQAEDLAHV